MISYTYKNLFLNIRGIFMIAIREIKKPINQQIIIDLPDDFNASEVEVIIIPLENEIETEKIRIFGVGKDHMKINDSFYESAVY